MNDTQLLALGKAAELCKELKKDIIYDAKQMGKCFSGDMLIAYEDSCAEAANVVEAIQKNIAALLCE